MKEYICPGNKIRCKARSATDGDTMRNIMFMQIVFDNEKDFYKMRIKHWYDGSHIMENCYTIRTEDFEKKFILLSEYRNDIIDEIL